MGLPIIFFLPITLMIIGIIIYILEKTMGLVFKYHSTKNLILLLSVVICWYPFTVLPEWTVGTFNIYITAMIFVVIFYLMYGMNKWINVRYKNVVQIVFAIILIGFSVYWFLEIPPYGVYTSGSKFEDIPLQETKVFIFNFIVYGFTLIFFTVKYFKSKEH